MNYKVISFNNISCYKLNPNRKVVINTIIRMLYASHYHKRRDSVLPTIKEKVLHIYEMEKDILGEIVVEMRSSFANEKAN